MKTGDIALLTQQLRQCYQSVSDDLQEFVKFLEQLTDRSNSKETTL